ncbi:MAG TPA: NAD(P)H-hydrate epimerase [Anaerohalosphaeraceae bacterium]|nr:NAD(P)H-hydrate epimerase [Anaerohalosphaeraceae bacterium]
MLIHYWDGNNTNELGVMSRQEVRAFDRWAIEQMHIPGAVLMENAGRGVAECLLRNLQKKPPSRVVIFCGSGNNGGDGFVIARHLANSGVITSVILCGRPERLGTDAKLHLEIIEAMGLEIRSLERNARIHKQVKAFTETADWIVDALLGTGLEGTLSEDTAELIAAVNAAEKPILAVDIPSGLDCDEGIPLPVCIEAKGTVTFAALKRGFLQCPESRQATGDIYVASIGIKPIFWKSRQK